MNLRRIFDGILEDYKLQSVQDEEPDEGRDALKEEVKRYLKAAEEEYYGSIAEEYARATAPSQENES